MVVRTLDRYIASQFLRMFALCLAGFMTLYILVDFIERSSQIFKENPDGVWVLLYFVYKLPLIFFQMIPVACLLGSLLSLTILAKNSELTAIKAGGVPILRATASILVMGAFLGASSFAVNEFVVPTATRQKEYIYKVHIKKHKWRVKYQKKNVFYKNGNDIFSFSLFVPEQNRVTGVRLYRFDKEFNLVAKALAEGATYKPGEGWSMQKGIFWQFNEDRLMETHPFETMAVDLGETPENMKIYQRESDEMSYRELRELVGNMQRQGYDTTAYKVDLQSKLSFPIVSFVMALLGIPLAVRIGRGGGIALAIGVSVVLGVIYWIVLGLGLALGHSGAAPPFVAAWGSHILFGVGGLVALTRVRQ